MRDVASAEAGSERPMAAGVVVLNLDGARHLDLCLDSLRACDPPPARVVVVDNASRDDSVARVRDWARSRAVPLSESVDDEVPDPPSLAAGAPWLHLVRVTR